jgi:hypothetical protein
MDGIELDLASPESPAQWWQVRGTFEDGDVPWPEHGYPRDVMVAHRARLVVLRLRARSGSGALARVEAMIGTARGRWEVGQVGPDELLAGL